MSIGNLFILLSVLLLPVHAQAAQYVGSKQCKSCHQQEYDLWRGSHHDMAMRQANKASVLGDFGGASLNLAGASVRFYRKNEQYIVNMPGPDGKAHDYTIQYTFGFYPLQQYMVEFDDGRIQLIPYAWDSRDKTQGGQRWFNLYPQMTQKHQLFYWLNAGQNWNAMCADCHSTGVKKNFDPARNQYKTRWREINVACEACHGPASDHLQWTADKTRDKNSHAGFNRDLGKPVRHWLDKKDQTILQAEAITQTQQNLVCAQCHSRHTQLSENDYPDSGAFGDRYRLRLISGDYYYPDGQVHDEVYVYGSFLQSKMARAGVTCSNCHDPHSAKLKQPIENLCLQCHKAASYNTAKHHHHSGTPAGKAGGTRCIDCHMPQTTYMQIDDRADHGWPVPRPDLALQLGTPDTCLTCHKDKDSRWSLAQITAWYPQSKIDKSRDFAPAFVLADRGYPQASAELTKIAQDKYYPGIIRASALLRMKAIVDQNSFISLARGVRDKDELVRLGAAQGAQNMPQAERWQLLAPLLDDKVLAVRAEAARALAPLWQTLDKQQRDKLKPAIDDYLGIQAFNADRGFALTNRGNVLAHMGRFKEAEAAYDQSIRIEPGYSTAYVNKAELHRRLPGHNEDEVIAILQQGLKAQPEGADIAYSLGLSMIRNKQPEKAIAYLKKATELAPQNANYHYVYALSLAQSRPAQAQQAMRETYHISGNPRHLYALCEMQVQQQAFQASQCIAQLEKIVSPEVVVPLKKALAGLIAP